MTLISWEKWTAGRSGRDFKEGDEVECFCIVTTRPNALLQRIHNRMPAILDQKSFNDWLEGDDHGSLLDPFDADRMEAIKLSRHVNDVRNNDEACLEPTG